MKVDTDAYKRSMLLYYIGSDTRKHLKESDDTGVEGQDGRYIEPKAGLKAYFSLRMNTSGIPHERQNIKQTESETVLIFYMRVKGAVRTVGTIELLNC